VTNEGMEPVIMSDWRNKEKRKSA